MKNKKRIMIISVIGVVILGIFFKPSNLSKFVLENQKTYKVKDSEQLLDRSAELLPVSVSDKMDDVKAVYEKSVEEGRLCTYYEMKDGSWQCVEITYPFRLELTGRIPNAGKDSTFVVLTDNKDLTFEIVSKSTYSSSMSDVDKMKGSHIVEMR